MKKVTILMAAAMVLFAAMSFASLSLTGGGVVNLSYSSSPTSISLSPTTWWLQVTGSGTGYSYTANISDGSISSFYFTLPVVKNLSLILGKEGNFGESVFGGSAFSGPNGNTGWVGFGYASNNYVGAQYTSKKFNVYAQTTVSTSPSVDVYADGTFGPASVYFGANGNFATLNGGANVTVGPANVFGMVTYDTNAASVTGYTMGVNAAFGKNSVGAEYSKGSNVTAWFDTTVGKYGVELGTSLSNFAFSSAWAKATWTLVGNVSAELDLNYSSSSVVSSTFTMFTVF